MKKILLSLIFLVMLSAFFSCSREKINEDENAEQLKNDNISFDEYIGRWCDDLVPPNSLEIISVGDDVIEGYLEIYRLAAFDLKITAENKKITFEDKHSLISGKIDFNGNSVLVTVEKSNTELIQSGTSYLFTIKDGTAPQ